MKFAEWWKFVEAGALRAAGVLLVNMTDWNPKAIKALAEAAFEAGYDAGYDQAIADD